MTLPDEFKFTAEHCDLVYSAELVDGKYVITWFEECDDRLKSFKYFTPTVAKFIADGSWVIQQESFPQLVTLAEGFQALISEKKDASLLTYSELQALELTRRLITRLLDDRS